MDYQNDINEIIAFINGAIAEERKDYSECLSRFTEAIDEEFLQGRADAIKKLITTDAELQEAFGRLASKM